MGAPLHKVINRPEDLLGIAAPEAVVPIEQVADLTKLSTSAKPNAQEGSQKPEQKQPKLDGRSTRILLSTMKAYSPLVSAITYSPGTSATGEEAGAAMLAMMESMDRICQSVEKSSGLDRNDPEHAWAIGKIASNVAVHVGRQWRYISEGSSIDEAGIAKAFDQIINGDLPKVEDDLYVVPEDDTGLRLSMLRALSPVMVEARILADYMRDARLEKMVEFSEDAIVSQAADDIFQVAADMVTMMNGKGDERDRLIMMESCIGQCGFLYASSLAHTTDKLMTILGDAADNGTLNEALKGLHKTSGIDMDAVYEQFEGSAMRLAGVASRFGVETRKPNGPKR